MDDKQAAFTRWPKRCLPDKQDAFTLLCRVGIVSDLIPRVRFPHLYYSCGGGTNLNRKDDWQFQPLALAGPACAQTAREGKEKTWERRGWQRKGGNQNKLSRISGAFRNPKCIDEKRKVPMSVLNVVVLLCGSAVGHRSTHRAPRRLWQPQGL